MSLGISKKIQHDVRYSIRTGKLQDNEYPLAIEINEG